MVVNSRKGVTSKMTTNLAPKVITQTQEYWATLGIDLDEEQAEETARTYLALIDLVAPGEDPRKGVDHEAA